MIYLSQVSLNRPQLLAPSKSLIQVFRYCSFLFFYLSIESVSTHIWFMWPGRVISWSLDMKVSSWLEPDKRGRLILSSVLVESLPSSITGGIWLARAEQYPSNPRQYWTRSVWCDYRSALNYFGWFGLFLGLDHKLFRCRSQSWHRVIVNTPIEPCICSCNGCWKWLYDWL